MPRRRKGSSPVPSTSTSSPKLNVAKPYKKSRLYSSSSNSDVEPPRNSIRENRNLGEGGAFGVGVNSAKKNKAQRRKQSSRSRSPSVVLEGAERINGDHEHRSGRDSPPSKKRRNSRTGSEEQGEAEVVAVGRSPCLKDVYQNQSDSSSSVSVCSDIQFPRFNRRKYRDVDPDVLDKNWEYWRVLSEEMYMVLNKHYDFNGDYLSLKILGEGFYEALKEGKAFEASMSVMAVEVTKVCDMFVYGSNQKRLLIHAKDFRTASNSGEDLRNRKICAHGSLADLFASTLKVRDILVIICGQNFIGPELTVLNAPMWTPPEENNRVTIFHYRHENIFSLDEERENLGCTGVEALRNDPRYEFESYLLSETESRVMLRPVRNTRNVVEKRSDSGGRVPIRKEHISRQGNKDDDKVLDTTNIITETEDEKDDHDNWNESLLSGYHCLTNSVQSLINQKDHTNTSVNKEAETDANGIDEIPASVDAEEGQPLPLSSPSRASDTVENNFVGQRLPPHLFEQSSIASTSVSLPSRNELEVDSHGFSKNSIMADLNTQAQTGMEDDGDLEIDLDRTIPTQSDEDEDGFDQEVGAPQPHHVQKMSSKDYDEDPNDNDDEIQATDEEDSNNVTVLDTNPTETTRSSGSSPLNEEQLSKKEDATDGDGSRKTDTGSLKLNGELSSADKILGDENNVAMLAQSSMMMDLMTQESDTELDEDELRSAKDGEGPASASTEKSQRQEEEGRISVHAGDGDVDENDNNSINVDKSSQLSLSPSLMFKLTPSTQEFYIRSQNIFAVQKNGEFSQLSRTQYQLQDEHEVMDTKSSTVAQSSTDAGLTKVVGTVTAADVERSNLNGLNEEKPRVKRKPPRSGF